MEITSNHIHFFISYTVAFVAFSFIGLWYLWPPVIVVQFIIFDYLRNYKAAKSN